MSDPERPFAPPAAPTASPRGFGWLDLPFRARLRFYCAIGALIPTVVGLVMVVVFVKREYGFEPRDIWWFLILEVVVTYLAFLALYLLVDGVYQLVRRLLRRLRGAPPTAPEPPP